MPGQAGQKGETVKRLCRFNPSQPPKGGAINARAPFSLAFSLGGARASCHLRHSVPDKEAVHVRVAPVGGFLVLHSRAGSARRQRRGWRLCRLPRLRRRASMVSRHWVSACLSVLNVVKRSD